MSSVVAARRRVSSAYAFQPYFSAARKYVQHCYAWLMAKRNLTLRIDEKAIQQGKIHAAKRGISMSELVSRYFMSLDSEDLEYQRLLAEGERLIEAGAFSGISKGWNREEAHQR
jgi:hypothetical protein